MMERIDPCLLNQAATVLFGPPPKGIQGISLVLPVSDPMCSPRQTFAVGISAICVQTKRKEWGSNMRVNYRESVCEGEMTIDERLIQGGASTMRDDQLLSEMGMSKALATKISSEYGVGELSSMSVYDLKQIGIKDKFLKQFLASREVGRRMFGVSGPQIVTPEDAYIQFVELGTAKKEMFKALYLDGRRRMIHSEIVSIGTISSCLVHPREVFSPALAHGAGSVVVAHNHPSGDPSPSPEDRLLTERLVQAGRILGVNLDDHLVVGRGCFVSLRQLGLICGG